MEPPAYHDRYNWPLWKGIINPEIKQLITIHTKASLEIHFIEKSNCFTCCIFKIDFISRIEMNNTNEQHNKGQ